MKSRKILFVFLLISCIFLHAQEVEVPLAPEEYRKPKGYDPTVHRYKYSLLDLREMFSEKMMNDAAEVYNRVLETNAQGKWKPTGQSLYRHKIPEWFEDLKFGMFIDWGLWSLAGWSPKNDGAMYPDWYELRMYSDPTVKKYHEKNWGKDFMRDDFIPLFKGSKYNPDNLINIAINAGMKYVIPFSKHHTGFCLWPSSFTHRDVGDRMGKDFIQPLVDNCKEKGLKFGFYFSLDEWDYPIIAPDGTLKIRKWSGRYDKYDDFQENISSGKVPVKDFNRDYIVPQAVEFIDKYDPDILWYDGEWNTDVNLLGSYDISAYFYNQAEGRKEVAINDRYGREADERLRSHIGDYYTSEFHNHMVADKSFHPWEECRGISQSYGFNWQDTDENVISSKQFIDMFIDIVSKGGNLLLVVNLDAQGALPKFQEKRLDDVGKWLKVNGEGIYSTRAYTTTSEGDVRYTRSKDNKTVYAISLKWPGETLCLSSVKLEDDSKVYMLGYEKPLKWSYSCGYTTIILPQDLQKEANRPCKYAYTFRITNHKK